MKILFFIPLLCLLAATAQAEPLRLTPPRTHFLNEQLRDKEQRNSMKGTQNRHPDRSKIHHANRPDPRKLNPGRGGKRMEAVRDQTHTTVPVQPVYQGENRR